MCKVLEYLIENYDFDECDSLKMESIKSDLKEKFDNDDYVDFCNLLIFFDNMNEKLSEFIFSLMK